MGDINLHGPPLSIRKRHHRYVHHAHRALRVGTRRSGSYNGTIAFLLGFPTFSKGVGTSVPDMPTFLADIASIRTNMAQSSKDHDKPEHKSNQLFHVSPPVLCSNFIIPQLSRPDKNMVQKECSHFSTTYSEPAKTRPRHPLRSAVCPLP